jgi:hypothetical protein
VEQGKRTLIAASIAEVKASSEGFYVVVGGGFAALTEVQCMARQVLSLVECFVGVADPRIERGKHHRLIDILCLAVLAVFAGAEGWEDIEEFGQQKQDWPRKFLRLPHGILSHHTISRVFRRIKPTAFQQGFAAWIASLDAERREQQVAIDGNTLRRSHNRRTMKSALRSVCAWGVEQRLVLAQQASVGQLNASDRRVAVVDSST